MSLTMDVTDDVSDEDETAEDDAPTPKPERSIPTIQIGSIAAERRAL